MATAGIGPLGREYWALAQAALEPRSKGLNGFACQLDGLALGCQDVSEAPISGTLLPEPNNLKLRLRPST